VGGSSGGARVTTRGRQPSLRGPSSDPSSAGETAAGAFPPLLRRHGLRDGRGGPRSDLGNRRRCPQCSPQHTEGEVGESMINERKVRDALDQLAADDDVERRWDDVLRRAAESPRRRHRRKRGVLAAVAFAVAAPAIAAGAFQLSRSDEGRSSPERMSRIARCLSRLICSGDPAAPSPTLPRPEERSGRGTSAGR
jgi:hypothetical protein